MFRHFKYIVLFFLLGAGAVPFLLAQSQDSESSETQLNSTVGSMDSTTGIDTDTTANAQDYSDRGEVPEDNTLSEDEPEMTEESHMTDSAQTSEQTGE